MIYIDGMVLRLMQLMQNPHTPPHLCRRREYRQTEHFFVNCLRTRKRKDYPSGLNTFYCLGIQPFIPSQRILYRIAVFGKSRRVKHNQIILVAYIRHIFKRLACMRLMRGTRRKIACHITFYQLHGLFADVHRIHPMRSTPQGIHRKTARIAKHIQHITPLGITLQQGSILTLVNKKSRLLTAQPVYPKLLSVFQRPKITV